MAANLFLAVALLSITGSTVYILLKLLLVVSGDRLSQSWRYHSIVAVAMLFVLPLYKLWALAPIPHRVLPSIIAASTNTGSVYLPSAAVGELSPQPASVSSRVDWGQMVDWTAALWLLAAVGLILWNIWHLLHYRRLIEQASNKVNSHLQQIAVEAAHLVGVTGEVRLLASPLVQSPMLVGFFRPTILLPSEHLPENDARFILAHELTHFRRGDLWKKLLINMIQCVHWFNPIVYLLNRDFAYWLETSCDEQVVSSLDYEQRKEYGYLLINYAPTSRYAGPKLYVSFTSCRYKLKRRISTMLKSNKKSHFLLGLMLALALIVGCLATSAFAASNDPASSTVNEPAEAFVTNEDGNSAPVSSSQVVIAPKFSVDKDGNCTPDTDTDLSGLLKALDGPEHQFDQDGDVEYKLIPKNGNGLEDDQSYFPPTRTEEEWQQIIADIESGKIPPLEIPDDPNITVSFVDYDNGNCVAGN